MLYVRIFVVDLSGSNWDKSFQTFPMTFRALCNLSARSGVEAA